MDFPLGRVNFFITVIVLSITLFLGFKVIIKDRKNKVNRCIGILMIILGFWLFSSSLADVSSVPKIALLWNRLSIVGPIIAAAFFLYFSFVFTSRKIGLFNRIVSLVLIPLSLLSLTLTKFNIESIRIYPWGTDYKPGLLYGFLLVYLIFCGVYSFLNFRKYYRTSYGLEREQMKYIAFGSYMVLIVGVTTNLILPLFFHYTLASIFGPSAAVMFLSLASYALIKRRLFDLKIIIQRSIVYSLLFLSVISIYALLSLGLNKQPSIADFTPVIFLFLLCAVIGVGPLKIFFQKITDKFFRRSADRLNILLNKINVIVNKNFIHQKDLLESIVDIIIKNLGIKEAHFLLKGAGDGKAEFFTGENYRQKKNAIAGGNILSEDSALVKYLTQIKEGIVYEEIEKDLKEIYLNGEKEGIKERLKKEMRELGASVCFPLLQDNELIGILVLGKKESGDAFSVQDMKLLDSLSPQIAAIAENAGFYEKLEEKEKYITSNFEKAAGDLQKLNEAKSDLVFFASHYLRTPLAAIKGAVSMLLDGDFGPIKNREQKTYLSKTYANAEKLISLVDDLLSRINNKIENSDQ